MNNPYLIVPISSRTFRAIDETLRAIKPPSVNLPKFLPWIIYPYYHTVFHSDRDPKTGNPNWVVQVGPETCEIHVRKVALSMA